MRAVEAFVANAGAALANVSGIRSLGEQQELSAELAEDVVVGVNHNELGKLPAARIGALGAGLQALRDVAETVALLARPIGHARRFRALQPIGIESEIEDEQVVTAKQ